MVIYGAILAGGKGMRMEKADLPKQYLKLHNKPIIIITLEKFLQCSRFDKIYIACHKDWINYLNKLLSSYLTEQQISKVIVIEGGRERIDSFTNIMNAVIDANGINDDDILICHDSVRPFVRSYMIEDCINITLKEKLAQVVIPVADTIFTSDKEGFITNTLPRNTLYQGQTPTGFQVKLLNKVLSEVSEEDKSKSTGTTQLFMHLGYSIGIIKGHTSNFKITTDHDLDVANKLYGEELEYEN